MSRLPLLVVALGPILVCASHLTSADWQAIERFPELADYIDADHSEFGEVAEQMHTGEWYRERLEHDLPDYEDATVEFGAGE